MIDVLRIRYWACLERFSNEMVPQLRVLI